MVNSRTKGATAERKLVQMLKDSVGDIVDCDSIKRNLDQYQKKDCTDIILGEIFAVECKHYKSGNWYKEDWWLQAQVSAKLLNMIPVLVWRYDRQPFRVTLPIYAVNREFALDDDLHDFPREGNAIAPVTMDFDTAVMVMREWL
jgi:Holliday junction resolvase